MADEVSPESTPAGTPAGQPAASGGLEGGAGAGHDPDDPFAGLVLDESFVRAASVYEAPARTRAAVRRHGGPDVPGRPARRRRRVTAATPPSPRDWSPAEAPARRARARLVGISVGLVAVLSLGYFAVLPRLHHGDDPPAPAGAAPGALPSAPAGATPANAGGLAPAPAGTPTSENLIDNLNFRRGGCYRWNQELAVAHADGVPCTQTHLFEAVERTSMDRAEYAPGAAYPTPDEWDTIVDRYCTAPLTTFLGYPLDPHGAFGAGAIQPSRESWPTGDRSLVCGLSHNWYEANHPVDWFYSFTGAVEGADQSWIYPTGSCLASDHDHFLGTIPCDRPHSEVVIGKVTLPGAPGSPAPSQDAFTDLAGPRCDAVARGYLGAGFRSSTTVRAGWMDIEPDSWAAGTRSTNCLIYFTTPSNEQRQVTGELGRADQGVPA
ncbi:septum formation family protein [Pseudofrankia saprophytica]|uniref:septum formation family protein n=1 Tax=Pseudofrankia saprophytica TaxID=298655 RepID=UPI000234D721|nr:septum formation family protein [Pseudofrankia saprophytica]